MMYTIFWELCEDTASSVDQSFGDADVLQQHDLRSYLEHQLLFNRSLLVQ